MLMIPAIPLLAFFKASIRFILTHIRQTYPTATTMLLVIRVPRLMTLDSSIAHMFLSKWYVPLVRTPSSQKSALRPDTVLLRTHSHKAPLLVLVLSLLTPTVTTEEYVLRTLCDLNSRVSQRVFGPSFFI